MVLLAKNCDPDAAINNISFLLQPFPLNRSNVNWNRLQSLEEARNQISVFMAFILSLITSRPHLYAHFNAPIDLWPQFSCPKPSELQLREITANKRWLKLHLPAHTILFRASIDPHLNLNLNSEPKHYFELFRLWKKCCLLQ